MPLQNRVDPFGDIHAAPHRGLFTGNRGVIHDPETRTLLKRRWSTRAWIICRCEFKGMKREAMGRNTPSGRAGWTELFFLDEVTALAAGHRPCFYCQRGKALEFAARFPGAPLRAPEMDSALHGERAASSGARPGLSAADLRLLPQGAIVLSAGRAFAKYEGWMRRWTFEGYGDAREDADGWMAGEPCLVTPRSTVEALRNGYEPVWHPSIGRNQA